VGLGIDLKHCPLILSREAVQLENSSRVSQDCGEMLALEIDRLKVIRNHKLAWDCSQASFI
jgi:hypothetical protein